MSILPSSHNHLCRSHEVQALCFERVCFRIVDKEFVLTGQALYFLFLKITTQNLHFLWICKFDEMCEYAVLLCHSLCFWLNQPRSIQIIIFFFHCIYFVIICSCDFPYAYIYKSWSACWTYSLLVHFVQLNVCVFLHGVMHICIARVLLW